MEAGVAFAYGATLSICCGPTTAACAASSRRRGRACARLGAGLVVGADGLRSHGGPPGRRDRSPGPERPPPPTFFGYWSGVPVDGYHWYCRPGAERRRHPHQRRADAASSHPYRPARFAEVFRGDIDRGYRQVLSEVAPDLAVRLPHGDARRRLAGHRRASRASCGAPPVRAGRWSVTPATSRIRSRPTASPTRCIDAETWRARSPPAATRHSRPMRRIAIDGRPAICSR